MKNITPLLVLSLFVVFAGGAARAADDKPAKPKAGESAKPAGKEVTLAGTFGCGKCSFKEDKQCQNVLKVKDGAKTVRYEVAKNPVSDKEHEAICHNAGKPAHVTGSVAEEGGKKTITPSAIKFD